MLPRPHGWFLKSVCGPKGKRLCGRAGTRIIRSRLRRRGQHGSSIARDFTGRANHYVGSMWHYELVTQESSYAPETVQIVTSTEENLFTSVSIGLCGSSTPPVE